MKNSQSAAVARKRNDKFNDIGGPHVVQCFEACVSDAAHVWATTRGKLTKSYLQWVRSTETLFRQVLIEHQHRLPTSTATRILENTDKERQTERIVMLLHRPKVGSRCGDMSPSDILDRGAGSTPPVRQQYAKDPEYPRHARNSSVQLPQYHETGPTSYAINATGGDCGRRPGRTAVSPADHDDTADMPDSARSRTHEASDDQTLTEVNEWRKLLPTPSFPHDHHSTHELRDGPSTRIVWSRIHLITGLKVDFDFRSASGHSKSSSNS